MNSVRICAFIAALLPVLAAATHDLDFSGEQTALAIIPEKQLSIIPPKKCHEVGPRFFSKIIKVFNLGNERISRLRLY
jgi:hypothetical protein